MCYDWESELCQNGVGYQSITECTSRNHHTWCGEPAAASTPSAAQSEFTCEEADGNLVGYDSFTRTCPSAHPDCGGWGNYIIGIGGAGDSLAACINACEASECFAIYYSPFRGCGQYFGGDHNYGGNNWGVQYYECTSTTSSVVAPSSCTAGNVIDDSGEIIIQDYDHNLDCSWTLICSDGAPSLSFDTFETEANFDFVYLFEGADPTGLPLVWGLSGSGHTNTYESSTSASLYLQFTSDYSVSRAGFSATFGCAGMLIAEHVAEICEHTYNPNVLTRNAAEAACVANGGHLASITSQSVQDEVSALVPGSLPGTINYWIGGFKGVGMADGTWTWSSDETATLQGTVGTWTPPWDDASHAGQRVGAPDQLYLAVLSRGSFIEWQFEHDFREYVSVCENCLVAAPPYVAIGAGICAPVGVRVFEGPEDNGPSYGTLEERRDRCAAACANQATALHESWSSLGEALGFSMTDVGRCYCNHVDVSSCPTAHEAAYLMYEFVPSPPPPPPSDTLVRPIASLAYGVCERPSEAYGPHYAEGAACSGGTTMVGEGLVDFSSGYAPNSRCVWNLQCPDGGLPVLEVLDFETEANEDYLYVYDGSVLASEVLDPDTLADIPQLLTMQSGTSQSGTVVGTTSEMTAIFTSDHQVQQSGFMANFECTVMTCVDSDAGATGAWGRTCDTIGSNCLEYNNDEFIAGDMCCTCGGGYMTDSVGPVGTAERFTFLIENVCPDEFAACGAACGATGVPTQQIIDAMALGGVTVDQQNTPLGLFVHCVISALQTVQRAEFCEAAGCGVCYDWESELCQNGVGYQSITECTSRNHHTWCGEPAAASTPSAAQSEFTCEEADGNLVGYDSFTRTCPSAHPDCGGWGNYIIGIGGAGDSLAACINACEASECFAIYYSPFRGCGQYFGGDHNYGGNNWGVQYYECTSTTSSVVAPSSCTAGNVIDDSGEIIIQDYDHNLDCSWTLICSDGAPSLSFDTFETEANFDFVYLFEGADPTGLPLVWGLSGSGHTNTYESSTSASLYLQFTSDYSVSRAGFSATFGCAGMLIAEHVAEICEHTYNPNVLTRNAAEAACVANGGHLASITSQSVQDEVSALVPGSLPGTINYWIGGFKGVGMADGTWTWSSDETATLQGTVGTWTPPWDDASHAGQRVGAPDQLYLAVLSRGSFIEWQFEHDFREYVSVCENCLVAAPPYVAIGGGICAPVGVRVFEGLEDNGPSYGTLEERRDRCAAACANQATALHESWSSLGEALGFSMTDVGRCYCNHVDVSSCPRAHDPPYLMYEFVIEHPQAPRPFICTEIGCDTCLDTSKYVVNAGLRCATFQDVEFTAAPVGWVQPPAQSSCTGTTQINDYGVINIQNYMDNLDCSWTLTCSDGSPSVSFGTFQTEANFDFVYLYQGADSTGDLIMELDGSHTALTRGTSFDSSMYLRFYTDGSVVRDGFSATFSCNTGSSAPYAFGTSLELCQDTCDEVPTCVGIDHSGPDSSGHALAMPECHLISDLDACSLTASGDWNHYAATNVDGTGSVCKTESRYATRPLCEAYSDHIYCGSTCEDSDDGAVGLFELTCAEMGAQTNRCDGTYDDDDFRAMEMCCVCGGGLVDGEARTQDDTFELAIMTDTGYGVPPCGAGRFEESGGAECTPEVTVSIAVVNWGNEMGWDIDDAGVGVQPGTWGMQENVDDVEVPLATTGEHTFSYVDSYGDGWHGGYWEVRNACNQVIAGGVDAGQVQGSGGTSTFQGSDLCCVDGG
eukprot:COSAG02_NODE_4143_length_5719_cov_8.765480_2_plen_1748_part_01